MEKKYLNFFDNIDLTCLDKENIRNEILYKKSNNTIHKFTFVIPLVVIMFCCCLGVSAKVIIDHFELRNNDNSFEKDLFSDAVVNKTYEANILQKDSMYKIDDISEKLDLNILKNRMIENSNYKLTLLSEKESFISELDFWLVNDDGSDTGLMEIAIGFAVKTKISDKKTEFYVNGNSEMKKYYIKSLDTIAVILDPVSSNSGPIIASFVYKDITYFVELQKTFYKYEDMQNILESFYL